MGGSGKATRSRVSDAVDAMIRRVSNGSFDLELVATFGVRLAILAGGFISSVVTARTLSPAGRGEYFVVITLAQTLAQFGNFGLHSSNTYFVARNRTLAGSLLANSIWLALLVGSIGSLGIVIAHRVMGSGDGRLLFTVVLAPATLFYMLGTNLLVGLRRIRAFNGFQLAGNLGVLFCLLVAAWLGAGSTGFLAASALGWTVVSLALAIAIGRETANAFRFDGQVFREGLRYALKAYVATLCGFLVIRSNVFLLNAFSGSEQVGYYSVATQIIDVIGILPQSVALILFPTLVASSSDGRFDKTMKNLVAVGLCLAAGCGLTFVLAEPFVKAVFGPSFVATVPLLRAMLPGAFFLGLTAVLSQYLAAAGFPLSLVFAWVGAGLTAITLGWLLIPAWSAQGAAIAVSVTHGAMCAAVFVMCRMHARQPAPMSLAFAVENGVNP